MYVSTLNGKLRAAVYYLCHKVVDLIIAWILHE